MNVKKAINKEIAHRYQRSRKKEKGKILDEFVKLTGSCGAYASWLLLWPKSGDEGQKWIKDYFCRRDDEG